ncbi:MAG: NUDIX hydrolase [Pyrinomonadaceae bacterium]
MLKKAIRRIWRLISPDTRALLVRSTQSSFTVSAAAVVSNEKGEVLLLNHVLRPYSGWGFPGGFIDKGEQAEDAIRREVREETGIELTQLKLYSIRTTGVHIEVLFSAMADGEPSVKSAEIMEVRWFNPSELPDDLATAQRRQIREILQPMTT